MSTSNSPLDRRGFDPAEQLRQRLRVDLKGAMTARNRLEVGVLRCLIAAVDNAQSVGVGGGDAVDGKTLSVSRWVSAAGQGGATEASRRLLTEGEVVAVMKNEAELRSGAAADLECLGRFSDAELARPEAKVAARYSTQD